MELKPKDRSLSLSQSAAAVVETITDIWSQQRAKKLPTYLFLALCFNLIVAPVVLAASSSEFTRTQAWSLGLLGLGTVALAVYLFFVMFVPERF